MKKTLLVVTGMSCEHCVNAITSAIIPLDGVENVTVDLQSNTVEITHDGTTSVDRFKEEIQDQGYDVV